MLMQKKVILLVPFLLLLGMLFFVVDKEGYSLIAAEGLEVEGRVNQNNGEKAIGAVITLKGTTTGTVTNTDGQFWIKVPSKNSILVVSHFSTEKTVELAVDGKSKHVVRLPAGK